MFARSAERLVLSHSVVNDLHLEEVAILKGLLAHIAYKVILLITHEALHYTMIETAQSLDKGVVLYRLSTLSTLLLEQLLSTLRTQQLSLRIRIPADNTRSPF